MYKLHLHKILHSLQYNFLYNYFKHKCLFYRHHIGAWLTLIVGFILVGIAVAVTTVSYLLNMTFVYQWLVWIIGIAFAGVALISLE